MGSSSSKSSLTITNDIVNKAIFDFSKSTTTRAESTAAVTQSINLNGAEIHGCAIEAENIADIKSTLIQEFSAEDVVEMRNSIVAALDTAATNDSEAAAGFMSTGSADSDVNTVIDTKVRNIVENTLSLDTVTDLVNTVNLSQSFEGEGMIYDPCGYKILLKYGYPPSEALKECKDADGNLPKCRFGNDAKVDMFSQQAASLVTSALVENDILADVKTDAEQSSSAKATGPIEEIGDALANIFGAAMIPSIISAIGILLLVLMAPMIIGALRGGGNNNA